MLENSTTPALAGGARENKDFTDKVLRIVWDYAQKMRPL